MRHSPWAFLLPHHTRLDNPGTDFSEAVSAQVTGRGREVVLPPCGLVPQLQLIYLKKKTLFIDPFYSLGASLVAQRRRRLPAMQETQVQSLGWEDLLEKEMTTHSSILAWRIPWTEEPGRLQSMALQSRTRLSDFTFFLSFSRNDLG